MASEPLMKRVADWASRIHYKHTVEDYMRLVERNTRRLGLASDKICYRNKRIKQLESVIRASDQVIERKMRTIEDRKGVINRLKLRVYYLEDMLLKAENAVRDMAKERGDMLRMEDNRRHEDYLKRESLRNKVRNREKQIARLKDETRVGMLSSQVLDLKNTISALKSENSTLLSKLRSTEKKLAREICGKTKTVGKK